MFMHRMSSGVSSLSAMFCLSCCAFMPRIGALFLRHVLVFFTGQKLSSVVEATLHTLKMARFTDAFGLSFRDPEFAYTQPSFTLFSIERACDCGKMMVFAGNLREVREIGLRR